MTQVRANGIDIEYESFGRGGDPAILLIMGFAAQLTVWPEAFCEDLAAQGFRVVRFDNRDIGKSTHLLQLGSPNIADVFTRLARGQVPYAPYLLDDMAADAAGLLDALGIGSAHVVGASMGGMIAQIVAAKHGARARSLVSIMSTTGNRALPRAKPEVLAAITMPPASPTRDDRIAAGVRAWRALGSPGFPRGEGELEEFVSRQVDRVPYEPTGVGRQLVAVLASPPRNDLLRNVRCPALIVHGSDDALVPFEGGKDTAACIPGAKLVIVPGMGHDISNALVPVLLDHVGYFVAHVERSRETA